MKIYLISFEGRYIIISVDSMGNELTIKAVAEQPKSIEKSSEFQNESKIGEFIYLANPL